MSSTKPKWILNNFFAYHACHESWVLPFRILRLWCELIWRSNFCILFNDSCSLCTLYFCSTDSFSFRATFNNSNNLILHLWRKHCQILPQSHHWDSHHHDHYENLWYCQCNITFTKFSFHTQNRFLIIYGHASLIIFGMNFLLLL